MLDIPTVQCLHLDPCLTDQGKELPTFPAILGRTLGVAYPFSTVLLDLNVWVPGRSEQHCSLCSISCNPALLKCYSMYIHQSHLTSLNESQTFASLPACLALHAISRRECHCALPLHQKEFLFKSESRISLHLLDFNLWTAVNQIVIPAYAFINHSHPFVGDSHSRVRFLTLNKCPKAFWMHHLYSLPSTKSIPFCIHDNDQPGQ